MNPDRPVPSDQALASAAKWAANLPKRRKPLSPWDELPYFDLPITLLVFASTGPVEIVPANPQRVILSFATSSTTQPLIAYPDNAKGVQAGFPLVSGMQPVVITQKDYGPLAQVRWLLAPSAATSPLQVLYVNLRKW